MLERVLLQRHELDLEDLPHDQGIERLLLRDRHRLFDRIDLQRRRVHDWFELHLDHAVHNNLVVLPQQSLLR